MLSLFIRYLEKSLCKFQNKELLNALLHFTIGVEELDGNDETLEHLIPGDGGGVNLLLAPGAEVWKGGAPVCTT